MRDALLPNEAGIKGESFSVKVASRRITGAADVVMTLLEGEVAAAAPQRTALVNALRWAAVKRILGHVGYCRCVYVIV